MNYFPGQMADLGILDMQSIQSRMWHTIVIKWSRPVGASTLPDRGSKNGWLFCKSKMGNSEAVMTTVGIDVPSDMGRSKGDGGYLNAANGKRASKAKRNLSGAQQPLQSHHAKFVERLSRHVFKTPKRQCSRGFRNRELIKLITE